MPIRKLPYAIRAYIRPANPALVGIVRVCTGENLIGVSP